MSIKKTKKVTMQAIVAALCLTACSSGYKSVEGGIEVKTTKTSETVRLQVMSDRIVRVTAVNSNEIKPNESLIIVPQQNKTKFSVDENDAYITLRTKALDVVVNSDDGKVTFKDKDGNVILGEDGRSYKPFDDSGKPALSVRQKWNADDNEAYYGLGQHQADEFNYRGKNEELYQYNTKVSIPMIVSSKHYGILWDNYSYSKYGDERDYSQLGAVFNLYDKNGEAGALTGTYIPRSKNPRETIVRREDSLYFEYLDRDAHLSKVINMIDNFEFKGAHVTYDGEIEPKESGLFRFILYYAGYTKVTIDGKTVVPERWRTSWNPNSYKFAVELQAGKRVPIHIDWQPDGGVSYHGLRVLSPVDAKEQDKPAFWSEVADAVDYYFIYGDDIDGVVSGYRQLTGKAPVMPKWAMGYWQSRERYKTQDEIVSTLAEFRKRQIPIDNIVQDWSYWPEDGWGSHEFDAQRFPNPKQMVDSIHALNGRVMISVWPKFYVNTEHFKEFDQNGWMYRQAITDSIRDWIGQGYLGSFYDAYSADARKLFWRQMNEHLYTLGFDAWWMDASEPNIRDCTDLEYRKLLCGPTALGSSARYFNAYALMNAEAIYDGQRSVNPNQRVFLLTRSGFAGLQRYSTATWSGDIATRWEDMKAQISAGLNFAICGVPYWTMDIGGFCVEDRYMAAQATYDRFHYENEDLKEWRELNTRWFQFGAFCPLYRAHGQWPLREPWNIAPENHPAYNSIYYYTKLRYNLMPYIYSLAGNTYLNDYTIMRPLVMDFTGDTGVYNIGNQYMFGSALMVCPVYTYKAREREVYFPQNSGWYDFYTGKYIDGGKTLKVNAFYEYIPLFVRAGSIIPVGADIQSTAEAQRDLTIYVYGGADAHFTLYEDEGVNYNYEQGKYSTIEFTYTDATKTLTIGKCNGEFDGMPRNRKFNIVYIDQNQPRAFDAYADGEELDYHGDELTKKF